MIKGLTDADRALERPLGRLGKALAIVQSEDLLAVCCPNSKFMHYLHVQMFAVYFTYIRTHSYKKICALQIFPTIILL